MCQIGDSVFNYRQYEQDRNNIPAGSCGILQYSCVAWLVKSNTKFVFIFKEAFFCISGVNMLFRSTLRSRQSPSKYPRRSLNVVLTGLTLACHNLASGLPHTHVWHSDVLKGSLYDLWHFSSDISIFTRPH